MSIESPLKNLRVMWQAFLLAMNPPPVASGGSRPRTSRWTGKQNENHAYRRGFRSPFERRSNMLCLAMRATRQRLAAVQRKQAARAIRPVFE